MKNLLPGPTPVWIADDLSEVSTKVVDTESTYKALWDLFDGSHASDCPLPSKKNSNADSVFVCKQSGEANRDHLLFSKGYSYNNRPFQANTGQPPVRGLGEQWSFSGSDGMVMFFFARTIGINGFSMVLLPLNHHH